jgi:uncharacterized membrane protein (DUF4010 family)
VVSGVFVGALAIGAHVRTNAGDPGTTTEIAVMVTYVVGMLQSALGLAAALGVVVTILLASRTTLHRFVSDKLTA